MKVGLLIIRLEVTKFGTQQKGLGFLSKAIKGKQNPTKSNSFYSRMKGRRNMIDIFDGFTVNILYDENDKDFVANFVELPLVSAFGDTPDKALQELKLAWEGVKQSYINQGEQVPVSPSKKSYSGQFNVRIDKRLHKALAIEACQAHVSLNALVAQKLANESYSS